MTIHKLHDLAAGCNPVWLTQPTSRAKTDPREIEADWFDGKEFRVYRYGTTMTVLDTDRLLRAGFTHARVVYQRDDLSVTATDVALRRS